MIAESGFNLAAYAERVAKMSNAELLAEGKEMRKLVYPRRISAPGPSSFYLRLEICRKEWRQRHPRKPSGKPTKRGEANNTPSPALEHGVLDSFGGINVPSGHHIDLQFRVGRRNIRSRQSKLAAHDVCALGDSAGLVERDLPVCSLSAKTAVA
jgi:hypothetical protein